jgi:hypothetical protein
MIVIETSHALVVGRSRELVANALIDLVENLKYEDREKENKISIRRGEALNKYLGERMSECLRLHPAYTEFIETVSPLNGNSEG